MLLTCYGLTVGFDMVVGVSVGMVLAAFLFMRRMAEVTDTHLAIGNGTAIAGPVTPGVAVYEISGPLFFGAAQKAMGALEVVAGQTRAVVLLMDEVHAMDATGLVALESALETLSAHKCSTILSGVHGQPLVLLRRAGFDTREGVVFCASADEALETASKLAGPKPPLPESVSLRAPAA